MARQITIRSAGHCPPLWLRGGDLEFIEARGLLLGQSLDLDLRPMTRPFGPGCSLMVYTDGVLDAQHQAGNRLGQEGLVALVRHHQHLGPEALIMQLLQEIDHRYRVTDDLTLAVIRHL
jgi:phosphoserine phosphatase RsbU/P